MAKANEEESGAESKVEIAKRQGRHLRGTIAETLQSDATHFGHDDLQLLKFHGTYQQDDRDQRKARSEAEEKSYSFMVRVALPGGILTSAQYLALDDLAGSHANGTLRITTRQGFQFHGVLKQDLKPTIAAINQALATTIAACGDVRRNVMGCPVDLTDPAHAAVHRAAERIAAELSPRARAYYEIWLDGEVQVNTQEEAEPFYGSQFLPRKFKAGVALSSDNCVDIYSQDAGLLAVIEAGRIRGFNVLVGGGLGMTHGKGDTIARLAEPLGFVAEADGAAAIRHVAAIFRDHGNRKDRRHARLKYLINEWGIERFRAEFVRRAEFPLHPAVELPVPAFHDHLGLSRTRDGSWTYGVFIQSGRIADTERQPLRRALRRLVEEHRPGLALTGQQNLLFTGLTEVEARLIDTELRAAGVTPATELSPARRYSMACPALPTCGLAVAEAERLLPDLLDRIEAELTALGLQDRPITIRMTGCPNGCARPYTADLAFVGRSLGLYQVYVGGSLAGDRVADLYLAQVREGKLLESLRPLFQRWAAESTPGESLGDFYQRLIPREEPRRSITGRETPTAELVQLGGAR
ncbi:MAG: NADPH-dependent assimilatory sulfite reductase hemoprotein subunit [Gemmatimonadota bacterium]|nr:NADPH-dependent assimilatory sulfite reductase hemoprotein subunit [Gemmatimonadota bacterium]